MHTVPPTTPDPAAVLTAEDRAFCAQCHLDPAAFLATKTKRAAHASPPRTPTGALGLDADDAAFCAQYKLNPEIFAKNKAKRAG